MPKPNKTLGDRREPLRPGMPAGRGPRGHGIRIESAKDVRGAIRRLLGYLKPHKLSLVGVFALVVLSTVLSLAGPYLLGVAVDRFIARFDLAGLTRIALLMLGIYVAAWLINLLKFYATAVVGQRVIKQIRADLFNHMQTLSLKFFDEHEAGAGDLMSRVTNDVQTINRVLSNGLTQLASDALTLVGITIAMLGLSLPLALGTLVILPTMMLVTAIVTRRVRGAFRGAQRSLGALNTAIEENIAGVRVVQAFARERETIERFREVNARNRDAGIRAESLAAVLPPILNVMSTLSIAIVAGLGGWLAIRDIVTVGVIVSFVTYARRFFQPIRSIATLYNQLQSALAGAERIFEILDQRPHVADAPDAIPLPEIRGHVEFEHVYFGYKPGVPVLKDVCLTAKPGQVVALVGPTGAGKTTMVNLLSRFYDVDRGAIRIDGHDIRHVQQDSLRRQLGIVLQDTFLFSDTVMENIRYGRLDATDEEVIAAARLANADQFIRRLPQGYQTKISERGGNLSQGQRQLLSIARAILANPRILILDEATSNVDTRTEAHIQEALLKLMEGRTSFVIAHRLSTIRNADQVLVIHEGRIIERGTHKELLARRGFYYTLYMSQFRRAEVAERLASTS